MVDIIVPYYVNYKNANSVHEEFEDYRYSEAMMDDSLRNCAAHPYVRRIYIAIPYSYEQYFERFNREEISQMCLELSEKVAISPKISGRGTFRFEPGICRKEDRLSFINMGFTVKEKGLVN